jgi:SNF2 family DNA or RNA helicase
VDELITETQHLCLSCNKVPQSIQELVCGCITCTGCWKQTRNTGKCHTCCQPISKQLPKPVKSKPVESSPAKRPKGEKPRLFLENIEANNLNSLVWSAKTLAIKAAILNWNESHPGSKILLLTRHRDFINIMELVCQSENWTYLTYHGGLSHNDRIKNLDDFRRGATEILLATAMTCGTGLNIPEANLLLLTDPWWNIASNLQAFNRIYRIGQKQAVQMIEFVTAGGVQELMSRTQEDKDSDASRVLKPAEIRKNFFSGDVEDFDDEGNPVGKYVDEDPFGMARLKRTAKLTLMEFEDPENESETDSVLKPDPEDKLYYMNSGSCIE